jgi:DNA anti-recombination protein RmuC
MALSDQLKRLAARTHEMEDRAAAAHQKARADLERDVEAARESSKANAEAFRESMDASAAEVSAWWTDVGRSWDEHLAKMRQHIDEKVAAHDLKSAKRDAEDANAYASYLIDYCYAAVEEAEYAVLDATLAQMEFDQLAAEKQPS